MPLFPDQLTDEDGRPISDATVYVYAYDDTRTSSVLATLTTDGITPLPNPLETNAYGNYSFVVPDGVYKLDYWVGGKRYYTRDGVIIGEPLVFKGAPGAGGNVIATRSALAAITGTPGDSYYLTETLRRGNFPWSSSNHAADVTADPAQAIYVAPTSDPTGASGAWVRDHDGTVNAGWWGVIGDDATDNATALTRCAAYTGSSVVTFPNGTFRSSVGVTWTNKIILGKGRQVGGTVIKATSAMSAQFTLTGQNAGVEGIWFQAADLADHNILGTDCDGSLIDNCGADDAKLDGIFFPTTGNNSNSEIKRCLVRTSGHTYSTGTATNSAGGTVVTVSGAADLTTLGIRIGYDFAKVAAEDAREITAVSATTITVYPPLINSHAGAAYSVRIGSGICIGNNADNSKIKIEGTTVQNCAVAGIDGAGLYGLHSEGNITESCEFGEIVGRRLAGGEKQTINHTSIGNYFESCPSGYIYIGSCRELTVINPVLDGITQQGMDAIRFADAGTMLSTRLHLEGVALGDRYRTAFNNISGAASYSLNWGENVILFQSATDGEQTINLPVPTSGSRAEALLNAFDLPIKITVAALNGTKFSIKSTATVNGIAGATGIKHSVPNCTLECHYHSAQGWTVSGARLEASATYDPPSLALAASAAIQTITVTGAAMGDFVRMSFSNSLSGARIDGYVSAADTVSYYFTNVNGANPLDLASGTVTALVVKA